MKYDIKDKIIISDGESYEKLVQTFAENEQKFEDKQYNSMTEEVRRIIKTTCKDTVNMPLEEAFDKFLELSSKDINGNLEKHDLAEGIFYVSSKKTENAIIRVNEFVKNEVIEILWFTKTHKFLRRISFFEVNQNKTKLKFEDTVKSMTSVYGFMDSYKKNTYQKSVKKSFQVQILMLNTLVEKDSNKQQKMEDKIKKLQRIK